MHAVLSIMQNMRVIRAEASTRSKSMITKHGHANGCSKRMAMIEMAADQKAFVSAVLKPLEAAQP